jgi:hypothetical protein
VQGGFGGYLGERRRQDAMQSIAANCTHHSMDVQRSLELYLEGARTGALAAACRLRIGARAHTMLRRDALAACLNRTPAYLLPLTHYWLAGPLEAGSRAAVEAGIAEQLAAIDQFGADEQTLLWCAQSGVQHWQWQLQRAGLLLDQSVQAVGQAVPPWAEALQREVRAQIGLLPAAGLLLPSRGPRTTLPAECWLWGRQQRCLGP